MNEIVCTLVNMEFIATPKWRCYIKKSMNLSLQQQWLDFPSSCTSLRWFQHKKVLYISWIHRIYNFLQTCVMKYTFRYLVARGIQKNIFRYNSIKTRSPSLIALLYCTTDGGGRLQTWRHISCSSHRLKSKIVLFRSPFWLRLRCVSGPGPHRGRLVAPR